MIVPLVLPRMSTDSGQITALLGRWSEGDDEAFVRLVALAYDDLRAIAHRRLVASSQGETLSTTALVHEAFLRLARWDGDGRPVNLGDAHDLRAYDARAGLCAGGRLSL